MTRTECFESIFLNREEILPPDLEEIYEPRHLEQEEDEDDETETARTLSEREKRSSSDNTVTWDIRIQRSWLVRYGTQEQGEKLYGLFSKSYVVQRAKHDFYRCHPVQECCHAACVFNQCIIGADLVERWDLR